MGYTDWNLGSIEELALDSNTMPILTMIFSALTALTTHEPMYLYHV